MTPPHSGGVKGLTEWNIAGRNCSEWCVILRFYSYRRAITKGRIFIHLTHFFIANCASAVSSLDLDVWIQW